MPVDLYTSRTELTLQTGDQSFTSNTFGLAASDQGQKLPRIIAPSQRMGQVLGLELQGLVADTVEWFANGTATGETGLTYTATMMGPIFARITVAGEVFETPPIGLLHAHDDPSHMAGDDAVLALVPHVAATHIAITDGNWSDPATWDIGTVPSEGDFPLVPMMRTVTYDSAVAPRLDRIRVDGTLTWALDRSTDLLVETIVVHPTGKLVMGDGVNNRLPAAHRATITISNRSYGISSNEPTDLDLAKDPTLIGRGIVVLGTWCAFGHDRDPHMDTAPFGLPKMGDTSVQLVDVAQNWAVGDRIIIPGTANDLDANGVNQRYDEERTITAIVGPVVSWDAGQPLVHDHDHHNPVVPERGVFRLPIINAERNITVRSEHGAAVHQRGHCMAMHMTGNLDLWDVAFLNLGRTDKSIPAGVITASGQFQYAVIGQKSDLRTEPVTAQSNIQGRYPIHGHFLGFKRAVTPTVRACFVQGAKAWAAVHHGCEMDWIGNVVYRWQGAGLVAETGDEMGRWDNNVSCGLETVCGNTRFPKGAQQNEGLAGDVFRQGYGFAYRGRAMIVTRNTAIGCTYGHVFYHRGGDPLSVQIPPYRVNLDVNDLNIYSGDDTIHVRDYPITHFDDNQSIGTFGALAVIKAGADQGHDLNIKLTNFLGWATVAGAAIEYIGSYLLQDFLVVRSEFAAQIPYPNKAGFNGTKHNQVAWDRIEAVGFDIGIDITGDDAQGITNTFFSQDDPRFVLGEHTFTNCTTDIEYGNSTTQAVTKIMSQPVPYLDRPSVNLPFIFGEFTNSNRQFQRIASGIKTDTVSAGGVLPKVWDDVGLNYDNTPHTEIRAYAAKYGVWDYTDGDGTHKVTVIPFYWSDRLTARSIKTMQAIKWIDGGDGYISNGTFAFSASAPVCADITRNVTTGVEDSFNVLSGATGAVGTTLTLNIPFLEAGLGTDAPAHFKANYGFITVDKDGTVSYRSVPGFVGTDRMLVYVYDGMGRFCTVEITYNVTAA